MQKFSRVSATENAIFFFQEGKVAIKLLNFSYAFIQKTHFGSASSNRWHKP